MALYTTTMRDGPGPALNPVGGELQPSFETAYPGAGAYPIYGFDPILALNIFTQW